MPITNNHTHPSKADVCKPVFIDYIENTKGVWLRKHIEYELIELWYDGEYITSHQGKHIVVGSNMDPNIAVALMASCIEVGKKIRSKEIKDLING